MRTFSSAIRLTTTDKKAEVGIQEGTILVFTGHTTASVHLNNADKDLERDFHDFLDELIPNKDSYRHNKGDYGKNADAHFKSLIVGNSVTVPVSKGRPALGQWQAVYFSEFDGPRNRLISVKITGKK